MVQIALDAVPLTSAPKYAEFLAYCFPGKCRPAVQSYAFLYGSKPHYGCWVLLSINVHRTAAMPIFFFFKKRRNIC